MTLKYLYSKFFKKVLRGTSILNSQVDKTAKIYSGSSFYDSVIGRYSYIGYDSEVVNCEIGSFCSIANGFIAGGAKHPIDWVSTSPVFYNVKGGTGYHLGKLAAPSTLRIVIGHDVWIGSRAIVMQGVSIGNGAIVGAGAVVTKDVPPYAIVAGCPARIIRYRFDDATIQKLQDSRWWMLPDNVLSNFSSLADTPDDFCSEIGKYKLQFGGGKNQVIVLIPHATESLLTERRVAA